MSTSAATLCTDGAENPLKETGYERCDRFLITVCRDPAGSLYCT